MERDIDVHRPQGEVQEVCGSREWWGETGGQGIHNRTPETETETCTLGGHRDQEQGAEPLPEAGVGWEVGGGEDWAEAQAVSDQAGRGFKSETETQTRRTRSWTTD